MRCGRTGSIPIVAMVLALVAGAAPAGAQVTTEDVGRADAAVATAEGELAASQRDLDDARLAIARISESVARLDDSSSAVLEAKAAALAEAKDRIARLYIAVGAGGPAVLVDDVSSFTARSAYAGALAERDRRALVDLAVSIRAFGSLGDEARARLEAERNRVAVLEVMVAARSAGVARAREEADEARNSLAAQEEAQRRQNEEQRRLELAAQQAQAAAAAAAQAAAQAAQQQAAQQQAAQQQAAAAGYDPAAGVEQWRPLVERHFPAQRVEEALRVMRCESGGDPLAENPFSGAAGLFQQMPLFWPVRSSNAGFSGESPFHPEANIATSAWLVQSSVDSGLDPWVHWSCQP